jgi:hypothetical protein
MKLNGKLYDFLKWFALIALPALGILYNQLAEVWHLMYGEQVLQTTAALGLCIGVLIGVSQSGYKAAQLKIEAEKPQSEVQPPKVTKARAKNAKKGK